MEAVLALVLVVGCPAVAIGVPWLTVVTIGLQRRKRLEQDLAAREQQLSHLLAVTTPELGPGRQVALVIGAIVYSPDAAARNAHGWRRMLGGASASMQLRVESARRVATLRALEQANQMGARAVLNLRYETSELHQASGGRSRRQMPLVELIAYGTAWVPA